MTLCSVTFLYLNQQTRSAPQFPREFSRNQFLNLTPLRPVQIPRANTDGVLDYVFTLEPSNFDLHIILLIALKLYKIEWLISPGAF